MLAAAKFFRAVSAWRRRGGNGALMFQVVVLRSMAQGVNILTGLISAAMLGAGGRGQLAALSTGPGFLAGVASLGLHAALIYHVKETPDEERALLGNGMILTFGTGCLAAAIGWLLMPGWLSQYSPHAIAVARCLIWITPFAVASYTMIGAAEARGWFAFANRTLYLQGVTTLILLILLRLGGVITPETAAIAYVVPGLPVFVYFLVYTIKHLRPIFVVKPRLMGRLLHFGVRVCGLDLLTTCSGYVDQLLVITVLPAATVGAYVVALSCSRMLTLVQSSVVAVLFPHVAARGTEIVVPAVADCFRIVLLVTAACALVLAAAGPYVLLHIYGSSFAGAVAPFYLLLVANLFANGKGVLYQAYSACGRPGLVTVCEFAGLVLSIALMLVLVPRWGTVGAALSVLIANAVRMFVAAVGVRMVLGSRAARLMPDLADIAIAWRSMMQAMAPRPIERPSLEPVP